MCIASAPDRPYFRLAGHIGNKFGLRGQAYSTECVMDLD